MDSRLIDAVREDRRYAYEAYDFICQAVTFTQQRLGRGRAAPIANDPPPPGKRKTKTKAKEPINEVDADIEHHVSAAELLRGTCELAVKEFGMMAPVVFRHWGVNTTADVGHIVFNLIRSERLSQSDRDEFEDFVDVFDLTQALTDGFTMPKSAMVGRRGAER